MSPVRVSTFIGSDPHPGWEPQCLARSLCARSSRRALHGEEEAVVTQERIMDHLIRG